MDYHPATGSLRDRTVRRAAIRIALAVVLSAIGAFSENADRFDALLPERTIAAVFINDAALIWNASGWRELMTDSVVAKSLILPPVAFNELQTVLCPDSDAKRARLKTAFSGKGAVSICFDPARPDRRQVIALLTIANEAAFMSIIDDIKASVPTESAQFDQYNLLRLRLKLDRPLIIEITRIRPSIAMIVTEFNASVFSSHADFQPSGQETPAGKAGDVAYSTTHGARLADDPYYKDVVDRLGGVGDAFIYYSLPAQIAAKRADWLAEFKRQPPPIDETETPPALKALKALDSRLSKTHLASCRGMGVRVSAADGINVHAICVAPDAHSFINGLSKSVVEIQPLYVPSPDLKQVGKWIDGILEWRAARDSAERKAEAARRLANLGRLLDALEAIERQRNSDAFLVQSTQLPSFLCEAGFMPEPLPGKGWSLRLVIGSRLRIPFGQIEPIDLKTSPVAFWQPPKKIQTTSDVAVLFGDRSVRVLPWQELTKLLPDETMERMELSPSMFKVLTEDLKIGPLRTVADTKQIQTEKKEAESLASPARLASVLFGMRDIETLDDHTLNYVIERFALSVRDVFADPVIQRAVAARYQGASVPLSVSKDEIRSHSSSPFLVCHSFYRQAYDASIEIINSDPADETGTRSRLTNDTKK